MQQTNLTDKNKLFYVPSQRSKTQEYSVNFINLFKSALKKVYHGSSPKSIFPSYRKSKHELIKQISSDRIVYKKTQRNRMNTQTGSQSPLNGASQRRKLVKEILYHKNLPKNQQNKIQLMSKRCRTLDAKQNSNSSNQLDSDKEANMDQPKQRGPIKLRYVKTVNQDRQGNKNGYLPHVFQNLLPINKKKMMTDLQVIDKYRQLQAQYRSKQFLSVPIQISAISSQSVGIQNDQKDKQHGQQLSKLTKQSIIRSKTRKMKYAFQDLSRKDRLRSLNQFGFEEKGCNKKIQKLMEQQEILKQMWKEKQNKLAISSYKNQISEKYYHEGTFHDLRWKAKNKLKQKQPLDEYFQPWKNQDEKSVPPAFNESGLFHRIDHSP